MSADVSGGAWISLGTTATDDETTTAEREAFARPLLGIVPSSLAGGAPPTGISSMRGLCATLMSWTHSLGERSETAMGSPGARDRAPDQRMVAMVAIGFALALVPSMCSTRSVVPNRSDA